MTDDKHATDFTTALELREQSDEEHSDDDRAGTAEVFHGP